MTARPKGRKEYVSSELRLPPELSEWVKKEAERRHLSKNSLVIVALEALRDGQPQPKSAADDDMTWGDD